MTKRRRGGDDEVQVAVWSGNVNLSTMCCVECGRPAGDVACRCWIHVSCSKCDDVRMMRRSELESDVGFEIEDNALEIVCPRHDDGAV